jgi:hypothetical protein
VDAAGDLFIADNNNNTIREGVSPGNPNGPIGGTPSNSGSGNTGGTPGGTAVNLTAINGSASFLHPGGLTIDSGGNLYIADTQHHSIKKVSFSAGVSTFAGKDGTAGSADGVGTAATFNSPTAIAIGSGNTLFVTDTGNGTIRQILPDGTVSTLAGSTTGRGNTDGTGSAATFRTPTGIAINSAGALFVADSANATIRMVTTGTGGGVVTTVAGTAGVVGDADGQGSAARFNNPTGLAIDSTNNLYIADTYNDTIRLMTPTYAVTTLAGSAGVSGSYDGTGSYALFNLPNGLTVVSGQAVYVVDTGNNTVRYVSLNGGVVRTVAGFPGLSGALNGIGSAALFNQPQGIVYNAADGGIYVADTGNSVIRFIILSTAAVSSPTFVTATTSSSGGTTGNSLSSGGGAMEAWLVLTLVGLGGMRWWRGRDRRRPLR